MTGIISDLQQIYDWIVYLKDIHDTIEGNKDRCRLLITRCGGFENCLRSLDKTRYADANVSAGVRTLSGTIGKCVEFVNKYGKTGWKRFVLNSSFAKSIEGEFKELNALLSQSANDLHFSLSVHSYEIDSASTADNEAIMSILSELLESNAKITSDQSSILSRLDDQSVIMAKMAEVERMMPELLQRSAALLELVHQQQQQQQQQLNSDVNSPVDSLKSTTISPASSDVSQKSSSSSSSWSYDDLKFAAIDMDMLVWDKTNVLGRGSFATVYSCTYEAAGAVPCALKHFENIHELTRSELLSIRREARIMQVAKHRNIIGFLGVSVEKGIILSELAVTSLHKLLHKQEPPLHYSFSVKLDWLIGIASALRYLHFHGIIHRDIKPQNVLMCGSSSMGSDGLTSSSSLLVAKIADFGISTAVGMSTIGTNNHNNNNKSAAGSTPYMAPELIDFDESGPVYSPAVDVYAFGVTANETLSEQVPWEGLKVRQIERAVEKGMRPKPFCGVSECEKAVSRLIGDAGCGILSGDAKCRPSAGVLVSSLRDELRKSGASSSLTINGATVLPQLKDSTAQMSAVPSMSEINMSSKAPWNPPVTHGFSIRQPANRLVKQNKVAKVQVSKLKSVIPQVVPANDNCLSDPATVEKTDTEDCVTTPTSEKSQQRKNSFTRIINQSLPPSSSVAPSQWSQKVSWEVKSDVKVVKFSPDGSVIAVAPYQSRILIYDPSGRLNVTMNRSVNVSSLSFSPDGSKLAASSYSDYCVKLFDASSGRLLWSTTVYGARQVCFFNSSTLVATQGSVSCVIINVSSGSITRSISADGSRGLCVSNRGTLITAGEGKMTIWANLDSQRLSFGCSNVWSMCINSDGSLIYVGTRGGDILVYSDSGLVIGEVKKAHDSYVNSLSLNETNSVLASGGYDNKVKLWNASTLECIQTLEVLSSTVKSVSFSPNNNNLVSGSYDNTVKVWSCC